MKDVQTQLDEIKLKLTILQVQLDDLVERMDFILDRLCDDYEIAFEPDFPVDQDDN